MIEEKLAQKRIHQLPVHLANQIAAGEVVERPASVLKELLENSLDANSTEIEITVERGGVGLIQVQDNGVGIYKEDLPLAIASHATSKIASLADLEGVESYGFRGEALASIGSVSRLELSSSVLDQPCGWSIQLAGRDKAPSLQPVPKRPGTLIVVRDLFYNTPARRKFLKSEKTEMGYLEEIFKRVALSQPAVAFKFQQDDRPQKRLPICRSLDARIRRVAQLCGKRFIEEAYYIEAEANGLKLTGWLGSENTMRSQADLQYFYVNGRIVRDKIVMHAVRQAYQSANSLGRYPAYVLYFECDPAAVDVNVHPTKHEVRFREARTVHAFLSYAIQEGLKQAGSVITVPEKISRKPDFSLLESACVHLQASAFNPIHLLNQPIFLFKDEILLLENEEGLMIVDIKEARRVYLRHMLNEAYHAAGISKRPLLVPTSIVVSKSESIASSIIDWTRLGFELTVAGYHLVLVRSVPKVFGEKVENLNILLLKLFSLTVVEQCIALLVDYVLQNAIISSKDIQQLLSELKISTLFKKDDKNRFCKQVTLEQFKSIFL